MEDDVLRMKKQSAVLGTCETAAFILSLRDGNEFCKTHSSGYLCTPHIGVYGENYTVCSPIALISLPPTLSCLQGLPLDLRGALDLAPLCDQMTQSMLTGPQTMHTGPQTLQTGPQTMLTGPQTMLTGPQTMHTGPQTMQTAPQTMHTGPQTMQTAPQTMHTGPQTMHTGPQTMHTGPQTMQTAPQTMHTGPSRIVDPAVNQMPRTGAFNAVIEEDVVGEGQQDGLSNEPGRDPLKQTWAADAVEEEIEEDEGADRRKGPWESSYEPSYGTISIVVQNIDGDPLGLKCLAKMIVMKAIHKACQALEASAHHSTMDYLTASTKRFKIGRSPSPLKETREEEGGASSPLPMENYEGPPSPSHQVMGGSKLDASCVCEGSNMWGTCPATRAISPTVDRCRKRSRSHSQDSSAMRELDLFRMQKGITAASDGRLLEQEREAEEEELPIDAHFNILSSVTLSVNNISGSQLGLGTSSLRLGLGTNGPQLGLETNGPKLGLGTSSLQLGLETNGPKLGLGTSSLQFGLGTMINSLEKMSIAGAEGNHSTVADGHHVCLADSRGYHHHTVPNIDLFVVVHTYPPPSACQKFLCYKENEINLMYHFWLFPDAPLDDSYVRQEVLEMGVFEPHGVTPVHQNLKDGGVAFHYMDHRTVCIHRSSFSPENAQLELESGHHLHTFFSAARSSRNKMVVTYHVVPGSYSIEQQLRDIIGRCSTLSELVEGLLKDFPEPGTAIHTLVNSLQR